jgi:hypothetical protein
VSWKSLKESPLDSSVVSAVGGLIILLVGIIGLYILLKNGTYSSNSLLEVSLGTFWGLMILIFSTTLFLDRRRHVIYGALIIIMATASWYGTSGGLFVGFLIALIGGIMGMAWKPPRPSNTAGANPNPGR